VCTLEVIYLSWELTALKASNVRIATENGNDKNDERISPQSERQGTITTNCIYAITHRIISIEILRSKVIMGTYIQKYN
jgi:hypothetical protein